MSYPSLTAKRGGILHFPLREENGFQRDRSGAVLQDTVGYGEEK
jgi:hypothetical protein